MYVIIDTNIFRSNPKRDRAAFVAFSELCKMDYITLLVPEFVYLEVRSQILAKHMEDMGGLKKFIRSFNYKRYPAEILDAIKSIKKGAEYIDQNPNDIVYDFDLWLDEIKAERVPFGGDYSDRIAGAYFSGTGPFKSVKSRQDFPDSYIWCTVIDVAEAHTNISFITNDNGLYDSITSNSKITTHKTLEEFISTREVQELLRHATATQQESKNVSFILSNISLHPTRLDISIRHALSAYLEDLEIENDDSQDGTANIVTVSGVRNIDPRFHTMDYYGDGLFSLQVEFDVEFIQQFYVDKAIDAGNMSSYSFLENYGDLRFVEQSVTRHLVAQVFLDFGEQRIKSSILNTSDLISELSSLDIDVEEINI